MAVSGNEIGERIAAVIGVELIAGATWNIQSRPTEIHGGRRYISAPECKHGACVYGREVEVGLLLNGVVVAEAVEALGRASADKVRIGIEVDAIGAKQGDRNAVGDQQRDVGDGDGADRVIDRIVMVATIRNWRIALNLPGPNGIQTDHVADNDRRRGGTLAKVRQKRRVDVGVPAMPW